MQAAHSGRRGARPRQPVSSRPAPSTCGAARSAASPSRCARSPSRRPPARSCTRAGAPRGRANRSGGRGTGAAAGADGRPVARRAAGLAERRPRRARPAPGGLAGEVAAAYGDGDAAIRHLEWAKRLKDALVYPESAEWHSPPCSSTRAERPGPRRSSGRISGATATTAGRVPARRGRGQRRGARRGGDRRAAPAGEGHADIVLDESRVGGGAGGRPAGIGSGTRPRSASSAPGRPVEGRGPRPAGDLSRAAWQAAASGPIERRRTRGGCRAG